MSELGELLELMATAHKRYRTLHTIVFESFGNRAALQHHDEPLYTYEAVSELVLAAPGLLRLERRIDGELHSLVVMDGNQASTYLPDWGARVVEQQDGALRRALGPAAELVDPVPLIGALEFTSVKRGVKDGRKVFHAEAETRFELPSTLRTCDTERLVVDAERGVVLQLVGLVKRKVAMTIELRNVRFDVEPQEGSFAFSIPAEEEVSGLGLVEASMRASFPLWALPRVVRDITYRGERPGRAESVTVEYDDVLVVLTSLRGGIGWTTWGSREVERGGRSYSLTDGSVWFVGDSVFVALSAPGAEDEDLLALADSLVPVPT